MAAEIGVAIIGAGVVGLAVASAVAESRKEVYVFEKGPTFGLETSSRNSEVLHAGIYYPEGSLKAKLCVEGQALLYSLCERHGIGYKKPGKIVLAVSEEEVADLEKTCDQGNRNGVKDLALLSGAELRRIEPNIEGVAGLLSPSTGIVDSRALMKFFYERAREAGAGFVFNTGVVGIEKAGTKYKLVIRDREGLSAVTTPVVINCAGLESDKVAGLAGIDIDRAGYRLHYCKGEYFSLSSRWRNSVSRLIYPVPEQSGLGIHLTPALDGRMRLGPNARYVQGIDYRVDETQAETFYRFARVFLPFLKIEDLEPDFAGIRPKLQGPGEGFRDFVIAHEEKTGLSGLINLIGIESPGLTASPAIARYVGGMVRTILG